MNLNGYWSFTFDATAAAQALADTSCAPLESRILVPFPWGSKLSEVEDKGDVAWYGREICVPKEWEGKRVFLVVGASDWETSAWLDGAELGTHQGGYTPFAFELKDVEVLHSEAGQPFYALTGEAARISGSDRFTLSISHDGGFAVAYCCLLTAE